jgi:hypothetical protein
VGFLSHSVDVICKSCNVLPSRQGCIMLEVLWCCWISGEFWKIYCVNICRTPLAYSCLIHTQRDVRTLVTKVSGYLKLAWRIMIMRETSGCDSVLGRCFYVFIFFIPISSESLMSFQTFEPKRLQQTNASRLQCFFCVLCNSFHCRNFC